MYYKKISLVVSILIISFTMLSGCISRAEFTETLPVILGIARMQVRDGFYEMQQGYDFSLQPEDTVRIMQAMITDLRNENAFDSTRYPANGSEDYVLFIMFSDVYEISEYPTSDESQQRPGISDDIMRYEIKIKVLYQLNYEDHILQSGDFYISHIFDPGSRDVLTNLLSDASVKFKYAVYEDVYLFLKDILQ